MIYGYARCSTNDTKQDISRQKRDLRALGAVEVLQDYASGFDSNRPHLNALWSKLQPGDTLAVTELSRLTRSVRHLCDILERAKELRLKLLIGSITINCGEELDPMSEAMLLMMGTFAQLERNMTV